MDTFWNVIIFWHLLLVPPLALATLLLLGWLLPLAARRWPKAGGAIGEARVIGPYAIWSAWLYSLASSIPNATIENWWKFINCLVHLYIPLTWVFVIIWFIPKWGAHCASIKWQDQPDAIKQARTLSVILSAALVLDERVVRIPLLAFGNLITWFLLIWINERVAKSVTPRSNKIMPTSVLIVLLLLVVSVAEYTVKGPHLPGWWGRFYTLNYAAKWEFFALIATTAISIQYWREHRARIYDIARFNVIDYVKAYDCLWWIRICIVGAFASFTWLVFAPGNWIHEASGTHLVFLVALAWCFWRTDYYIERGITPSATTGEGQPLSELKQLSHNLVRFVDIPTFVAFVLLLLFVGVHSFEHSQSGTIRPFLQRAPLSSDPDIWSSEDYFISGMTAFQFLTMTVGSVLLGFKSSVKTEEAVAGEEPQSAG